MRIILHIGVWKTGSSAIQRFLAENAGALRARGVVAPGFTVRSRNGHNLLSRAARDEDAPRLAALAAETADEAAGAESVVLSSEHFWTLERRRLKLLADALRTVSDDIRIIAYIRPQERMWASLFAQQAKGFRILPGTPLWGDASFVGRGMVETSLFYGRCFTMFQRVFDAPLSARIYDRTQFPGGDVARDFVEAAGLGGAEGLTFPAADVNPSFGWKGVSFAIWCANWLDEVGLDGHGRLALRPDLAATVRDMGARSQDEGWVGRAPVFLSEAEQHEIRAHYAADTRLLSRRFFGGEDAFAPVRPAPPDPLGADHVPARELARAQRLFRRRVAPSRPVALLRDMRRRVMGMPPRPRLI